MELKVIAHAFTDFGEKFGIPRQAGLAPTRARIVFLPEFRSPDALRGLEDFSHIWILWQFTEAVMEGWTPTVRPPKLGGNVRMGVFATRSPYRPNSIGLSSVRLVAIERIAGLGDTLVVEGADMLDGTPIFDIKPYLPYTDAHPEAASGFAGGVAAHRLTVDLPDALAKKLGRHADTVRELLALDPRPGYHGAPERVYGMNYAKFNIKFTVNGDLLCVIDIQDADMIQ